MIIKLDTCERDLLKTLEKTIDENEKYKGYKEKIIVSTLPVSDIIFYDDKTDTPILYIERKTISDLLSSITDGRYKEQSYRLNELKHPNHNIIYLIEGSFNNQFMVKKNKQLKNTIYSSILSLNYFKGFSIMRTNDLNETAEFLCNCLHKLNSNHLEDGYYKFLESKDTTPNSTDLDEEKDYVEVIKVAKKKDHITTNNINEIMICQIPGISKASSLAIMKKFGNLKVLINELETNESCLNDIVIVDKNNKERKISKTIKENLRKYLLVN